jgi:threonine dehydratase
MPEHLVPLEEIRAARDAISSRVHWTPLQSSVGAESEIRASSGVAIGDGRLFLKAEHLQKTGSFKARGTTNKIRSLSPDQRAAGVITISAGNAAQAYAWAGRELGVHVVVVMPAGAVRSKVEACRGYGAEVVLHGAHVGETFAEMERIRDERGLTFCHPFDDPAVIAGHGGLGLELVDDLPEVDVVVVPVGGGGLIAGVATALKETRPSVRVFGVEPERSNALSLALEQREIVRISPDSVADGLGAPFAGAWTLAAAQRYLDGIVLLDDATILGGLRFAAERLKQVLEPAGAAALAAVMYGKVPLRNGERVCAVLSGGNVDLERIGELLAGAAALPSASPIPA